MSTKYNLKLKNIERIGETARNILCEQIIKDTKRYVPNSGGRLERSASIQGNGRYIVYSTPYAQYLWHGKLMLAPNGSSWAKRGEKKHLTSRDLKYNKNVNPDAGKYWVIRAKSKWMDQWLKAVKIELRRAYGIHHSNNK